MQDSRRINRIHIPTIDVTFRGPISMETLDVWREDRLIFGEQTYLVLDFGIEERVEFLQADKAEDEQDWRASGRVLLEVQQIDPATGEGLANPTFKEIAGEASAVVTWNGWQLDPCSPRRPEPAAAPVEEPVEGKVCLMCGSSDVTYIDADGTGRCAEHVGESPEADDDSTPGVDGQELAAASEEEQQ